MKAAFLLGTPLFLIACTHSTMPLTEHGKQVSIVNSLPQGMAAEMADLGELAIEESWQFKGDDQDARIQLRNTAGRDGADTVLLEEEGRHPCEVDSKRDCLYVRGRKFRRADSGLRNSEQL